LNKVRKLAEELVEKHQNLFSADFNENKQALEKIITIRNRAVRNQLAGIISVIVRERSPKTPVSETLGAEDLSPTIADVTSSQSSSEPSSEDQTPSSEPAQEAPAQESTAAA
jgi:ribosomal protein S17E